MPYDSLNIWHDPGNGQFAPRGFSTLKALAMLLIKGAATRDRIKVSGSGKARVADNLLSRAGIKAGDIIDVDYKNDDYASVRVTTKAGKKRKYDVQWARFDDEWVPDEKPVVEPVPQGEASVFPLGVSFPPERLPQFEPSNGKKLQRPEQKFGRAASWALNAGSSRGTNGERFQLAYDLFDENGALLATLAVNNFATIDEIQLSDRDVKAIEAALDDVVARNQSVLMAEPGRTINLSLMFSSDEMWGGSSPDRTVYAAPLNFSDDVLPDDTRHKFWDVLMRQQVTLALDPQAGESLVVADDAVMLPGGVGVVRAGGKINLLSLRPVSAVAQGWNPIGLDGIDDTPENWQHAVALAGMVRYQHGQGAYGNMPDLWNGTSVVDGMLVVDDAPNVRAPVEDVLRLMATPYKSDIVGPDDRQRVSPLISHPAAPFMFDKSGQPTINPLHKVYLQNNVFLYPKTLRDTKDVISEANIGSPGQPTMDMPFGLDNPFYAYGSIGGSGGSGGSGVPENFVAGYRPTGIDGPRENGLTYIQLESPDGPPIDMPITTSNLAASAESPVPEVMLAKFTEWWDKYGGVNVPLDAVIRAANPGPDSEQDVLNKMIEWSSAAAGQRAKAKERGSYYKPVFSVAVPNGSGGYYLLTSDRTGALSGVEVDADQNIWNLKLDYSAAAANVGPPAYVRTATRPFIKSADDETIRSVVYGSRIGLSPTSVKRLVKDEGVTLGPDGIGYNGKVFGSVEEYQAERHRVMAERALGRELGTLGSITPDSFTQTGFADLAEKALRVGEDNPKSKLKTVSIEGGGAWASQGSDLRVQKAWLSGFPVIDTVLAAATVETADLPDDPNELVPVPSWLQVTSSYAGPLQISRDAVTVGDDGVARIPAGLVADKAWRHMASVLQYQRNEYVDDKFTDVLSAIGLVVGYGENSGYRTEIARLEREIDTIEAGLAAGSPLLSPEATQDILEQKKKALSDLNGQLRDELDILGIPADTDYRLVAAEAFRAYERANGSDELRDALIGVLLDAQNGAWADSSQSHFSTMQAFVMTEMTGNGVVAYPEWNDWRTRRAVSNNYALDYSEAELMLARLVSLSTYTLTQQTLADKGLAEDDIVFLMRGSSEDSFKAARDLGGVVKLATNPLSSHATTLDSATSFGGGQAVAGVRVPRSRIFSTAHTGPGTYKEFEVVVIGDPGGLTARVDKPSTSSAAKLKDELRDFVDQDSLTLANAWVGTSAAEMEILAFVNRPPGNGVPALVETRVVEALEQGIPYVDPVKDYLANNVVRSAAAAAEYILSLPPEDRMDAVQRFMVANRGFDWLEAVPPQDGVPEWSGKKVAPEPGWQAELLQKAQNLYAQMLVSGVRINTSDPVITPPLQGKVYIYTGSRKDPMTGETIPGGLASFDVTSSAAEIEQVRGKRRLLGPRPAIKLDVGNAELVAREEYVQDALKALTANGVEGVTVEQVFERAIADVPVWRDNPEVYRPGLFDDATLTRQVSEALERVRVWDRRNAELQDEMAELVGIAGGSDVTKRQRDLDAARKGWPASRRTERDRLDNRFYGRDENPLYAPEAQQAIDEYVQSRRAEATDPLTDENVQLIVTGLATETSMVFRRISDSMALKFEDARMTSSGRDLLMRLPFDQLVELQEQRNSTFSLHPELTLARLDPEGYAALKDMYEAEQAAARRIDDAEASLSDALLGAAPILQLEDALSRRTRLGSAPEVNGVVWPAGQDPQAMVKLSGFAEAVDLSTVSSSAEFMDAIWEKVERPPYGSTPAEWAETPNAARDALSFDEVRYYFIDFYDKSVAWREERRLVDIDVAVATARMNAGTKAERVQAAQTALDLLGPVPSPLPLRDYEQAFRSEGDNMPEGMAAATRDAMVALSVGDNGGLVWNGSTVYGVLQVAADRVGAPPPPEPSPRLQAWLGAEVDFLNEYARERAVIEDAMRVAAESADGPTTALPKAPYPTERAVMELDLSKLPDDFAEASGVPGTPEENTAFAVGVVESFTNRLLAVGAGAGSMTGSGFGDNDALVGLVARQVGEPNSFERNLVARAAGLLLRNFGSGSYWASLRRHNDDEAAWRKWAITNAAPDDRETVLRLLGEMDEAKARVLTFQNDEYDNPQFLFSEEAEQQVLERIAKIERIVPGAVRSQPARPERRPQFDTIKALAESGYFEDRDMNEQDETASQRLLVAADQSPTELYDLTAELVETLEATGAFSLVSDPTWYQTGWLSINRPGQVLDLDVPFGDLFKSDATDRSIDNGAAVEFWSDEYPNLRYMVRDRQSASERYWSTWERWLESLVGPVEKAATMQRINELRSQMVRPRDGRYQVDPVVRDDLLALIAQVEQDALASWQAGPAEAPELRRFTASADFVEKASYSTFILQSEGLPTDAVMNVYQDVVNDLAALGVLELLSPVPGAGVVVGQDDVEMATFERLFASEALKRGLPVDAIAQFTTMELFNFGWNDLQEFVRAQSSDRVAWYNWVRANASDKDKANELLGELEQLQLRLFDTSGGGTKIVPEVKADILRVLDELAQLVPTGPASSLAA